MSPLPSPTVLAAGVALVCSVLAMPSALAYQRPAHSSAAFEQTFLTAHATNQHLNQRADNTYFDLPPEAFPLEIVFVGPPAPGVSADDMAAAMDLAANAWNDVACATAEITIAGQVPTADDLTSHQIGLSFDDTPGVFEDLYGWTPIPPDSDDLPGGLEVVLNSATYTWAMDAAPLQFLASSTPAQPVADLPSVLTHEFGHLLGLPHSDAHGAATMVPNYLGDGQQRQLSAADKLAACASYPRQASECDGDDECPPQADCVEGGTGAVCDKALGDVGDYCGLELMHCRGLCHFDDPATGTGYCTQGCTDDATCPSDFICDAQPAFDPRPPRGDDQANDHDDEPAPACHFDPAIAPAEPPGCQTYSTSRFPWMPGMIIGLFLILLTGRKRLRGLT